MALRAAPFSGRFWAKIDASAGEFACWPWTASLDRHGYGQFNVGGRRIQRAHRVALDLSLPAGVPADKLACHTCDNPVCCNPRHLYVGTKSTNLLDWYARRRRTAS